jgi:diguanylate cyclase (GGDEF)-like protein/PAS domain S-box-containing protein
MKTNFTERHIARRRQDRDSNMLARIIDTSPVPTFVIDAKHHVTHWNRACELALGIPSADMVGGKNPWKAFYPDARPVLADLIVDGDFTPMARYYSESIRPSNIVPGAYESEGYFPKIQRWLSFLASSLTDDQGRIIGAIETLQDITERKVAEIALQQSETLNASILSSAAYSIIATDSQGLITGFNPGAESLLGYSAVELVGKHDPRVFHDANEVIARAAALTLELGFAVTPDFDVFVATTRLTGKPDEREWTYIRKDGIRVPVSLSITAMRDAVGNITGYLGVATNIAERKLAEANLRIAAIAFEAQAGMIITDADNIIVRVNQAFTLLTGYTAVEAVGQTPALFKSDRHEPAFYQRMWSKLKENGYWQGEIWNRRKNGKVYAEMLTISSVNAPDGRVTHYVGTYSNISQNSEAEAAIHRLAFYDPLTLLPNRRLLLDRLQQAQMACGHNGGKGALLFIDLDNFKTLNDTLGHVMGDLLLEQVAKRLSGSIRAVDTVGRLGGDEFVVILEDLSELMPEAATQAEIIGEQIIAALNKPYDLSGVVHHSTPSIGVTLFGDRPESTGELLKRADFAMYQAKAAGRNTLRFYDPEMQALASARARLATDLHEAVRQGQFALYYQGQVDAEARFTGAETLVRWRHPLRGVISPADFIPLAEETGLILPLGLWILNAACAQLSQWSMRPEFAHLTLAVNVSARQFRQTDFVDQVIVALNDNNADPRKLKLELTESMLHENVEGVIAKMTVLKSMGVGFSLDDFGTGYSSLSYLKRLPLDQLKIDQSFVRDILTDPNDAAIARTIVALSENLGLSVIAEGVETEAQRNFLASTGCFSYQGYFFGLPQPIEVFDRHLLLLTSA